MSARCSGRLGPAETVPRSLRAARSHPAAHTHAPFRGAPASDEPRRPPPRGRGRRPLTRPVASSSRAPLPPPASTGWIIGRGAKAADAGAGAHGKTADGCRRRWRGWGGWGAATHPWCTRWGERRAAKGWTMDAGKSWGGRAILAVLDRAYEYEISTALKFRCVSHTIGRGKTRRAEQHRPDGRARSRHRACAVFVASRAPCLCRSLR